MTMADLQLYPYSEIGAFEDHLSICNNYHVCCIASCKDYIETSLGSSSESVLIFKLTDLGAPSELDEPMDIATGLS